MSLASIGWAQNDNQNQKNKKGSNNSLDQEKPGQPAGGQAVGKDEAKAYKAFYDARNGDAMKVIELGEGFLAKYPMSLYAGAVYSTLTTAYLNTSQPDKMVTSGQKALEINPDNVDVLPLLAWAIPRRVTAQTADGPQQLTQAEGYAKHAIQLLTTIPKPAEMDDAAFTKAKNEKLAMCHDGLGVAEVKTAKYDDAIADLNQSVELSDNSRSSGFLSARSFQPGDQPLYGRDHRIHKVFGRRSLPSAVQGRP